jgi:lysozyme
MKRRRLLIIVTAGIVALALVAAAVRYVVLPSWRPSLHAGETYGIDVSHHQGTIDWDAAASDNIKFAYIKATEGQGWVDDQFAANWSAAEQVGLERGVYHFFTLCAPGAAQAENFLEVAPPAPNTLSPAVDLEFSGNCSDRPAAADVHAELTEFIELVEDAWGRDIVLYVMDDWDDAYPIVSRVDREIWDRRILRRPGQGWYIWQASAFAKVDGISGGVDLNVMRAAD